MVWPFSRKRPPDAPAGEPAAGDAAHAAGREPAEWRAALGDPIEAFWLLADPTRLAILVHLVRGPLNVTALVDALGLKQPTVSHHLGLLRRGGLVRATRAGKTVVYQADGDRLRRIAAAVPMPAADAGGRMAGPGPA